MLGSTTSVLAIKELDHETAPMPPQVNTKAPALSPFHPSKIDQLTYR